MAGELGGMGRDSWTVLGARSDLPMRGDCLGPRDARREARPTIFLAELSMTREVLTGEVATGVDTTPAGDILAGGGRVAEGPATSGRRCGSVPVSAKCRFNCNAHGDTPLGRGLASHVSDACTSV